MQLEIGSIVEGRVTGITKFGAFIAIPEGKTGMVHISEISNSYVKEISDHLSEQQDVKVKVLSISEDGKISLSIKRCLEGGEQGGPPRGDRPHSDRPQNGFRGGQGAQGGGRPPRGDGPPRKPYASKDRGWQPKKAPGNEEMGFEDMITRFKQVSNDRMGDLKRSSDPRPRRRSK